MYTRPCVWASKWLKVPSSGSGNGSRIKSSARSPKTSICANMTAARRNVPWANGKRAIGVGTTARESFCRVVAILGRNREMRI